VIYVLDASAMIALLHQEDGWEVVRDLLINPDNTCLAHSINLCEVFYDSYRIGGEGAAQTAITTLLNANVQPREDLDPTFWQELGRLKAVHRRVSLADCSGITLARRVNAEVVTSDHREFDVLVPLGRCPIRFIR
jgi:PIN domain nuclease of toxin-antitoxin system